MDVTHHISEICKSIVELNFDSVGSALKIANIVNIMYRYGYCFHVYAYKTRLPSVMVPSPPLAEVVKTDYRDSEITLFALSPDKLGNSFASGEGYSLYQFQEQRERRYRDMLGEAWRLEASGELDRAEALLLKLRDVKGKGEVWGLSAKVQFRKGNTELAKDYCMQGVSKDPDYGPPYVDLGNYWLAEGNTAEALKWFDLAKQCARYPWRHEAYISCGRVYRKQEKYFLAMEQFAIALDMDPFNEGLRADVEELELLLSSTVRPEAASIEKAVDYSHGR